MSENVTRRLATLLTGAAFFVAAVAAPAEAAAPAQPTASTCAGTPLMAECDRAGIRTSSGDAALLSLENAGPGDTAVACVVVTYDGAGPAYVRLYGHAAGGGLDQYLRLTVTRGAGAAVGADGSCLGFEPDAPDYVGAGAGVVYDGPLAGFSADAGRFDPAPATRELWKPGERHAYRIAVELADDNAAQGLATVQTFGWGAHAVPAAGGGFPGASGSDSASPSGSGVATTASKLLAGTARIAAKALRVAAKVVAEVGKRAAFPILLVLVVAAFLAIQDRIDRRDPKLALAPVYAEPDLPFAAPPRARAVPA